MKTSNKKVTHRGIKLFKENPNLKMMTNNKGKMSKSLSQIFFLHVYVLLQHFNNMFKMKY
jgi:hypothetical protein